MSREIDLHLKSSFAETGDDQPADLPSPVVRPVRYPHFVGGVFDAGFIRDALRALSDEDIELEKGVNPVLTLGEEVTPNPEPKI